MDTNTSVGTREMTPVNLNETFDVLETLESKDEYSGYFNHLWRIFTLLYKAHEQLASKGHFETEIIKSFLNKFLFTIELLRLKHLYNLDRPLNVDLTESGFPHSIDMVNLEVDLDLVEEKLTALPNESILAQAILDHLFEHKEEPTELLTRMATVKYLSMLDEQKMFGMFVPGSLELRSHNDKIRSYIFSWGCYDVKTNRPYIHILFFDQNAKSESLEKDKIAFDGFLDVIRSEGSRVPDVGILALAVDQSLEDIYPKVLKRIGIGPVYGKYCRDDNEIMTYLRSEGLKEEDFVLFFSTSIVFSIEERVSKGLFSKGKIRQVFHIPESDEECYANKASKVHKYALAPHKVIQGISLSSGKEFSDMFGREVITCNGKEEVYAR